MVQDIPGQAGSVPGVALPDFGDFHYRGDSSWTVTDPLHGVYLLSTGNVFGTIERPPDAIGQVYYLNESSNPGAPPEPCHVAFFYRASSRQSLLRWGSPPPLPEGHDRIPVRITERSPESLEVFVVGGSSWYPRGAKAPDDIQGLFFELCLNL